MIRYDDRGVEELAAAVIELAYRDYVRGRMDYYAFMCRESSQNAKERFERQVNRLMSERRAEGRRVTRKGGKNKWAEMDDEYLRGICIDELEVRAKMGRMKARECSRFFYSPRFQIFASRIDGSSLIPRAEELLDKWLNGIIAEADCFPREYDYGIYGEIDIADSYTTTKIKPFDTAEQKAEKERRRKKTSKPTGRPKGRPKLGGR